MLPAQAKFLPEQTITLAICLKTIRIDEKKCTAAA